MRVRREAFRRAMEKRERTWLENGKLIVPEIYVNVPLRFWTLSYSSVHPMLDLWQPMCHGMNRCTPIVE